MSGPQPINIFPNTNKVIIQTTNGTITIIDNNKSTSVNVTQPLTSVIQVSTGPSGPKGDSVGISSGSFSGSFTGSMDGTASYALTASFLLGSILSASYSTFAETASYVATSSWSQNSISSSYSLTTSYVVLAQTASYVQNAQTASYIVLAQSASYYNETDPIFVSKSASLATTGSNIFTGSQVFSGSIRLDNSPDPDPSGTNISSSFIFVSASNTPLGTDLYFRQNGNLVKFKWLEGQLNSGILYGGIISGSGNTVYISSGSGIIVDHSASYTTDINPKITILTWGNISSSISNISNTQFTYFYFDKNGTLQQSSSFFSFENFHSNLAIGVASHYNYSSISSTRNIINSTQDINEQQNEFIRTFGPIKKSGLTLYAQQTGSLSINISSGTSYALGEFYNENTETPSIYTSPTFNTCSIVRVYRSGSGFNFVNNNGSYYTVIDPTLYDDGSGILQNSGANFTIQRVFLNPISGKTYIYYGQNKYVSLVNALQYLPTETFVESEITTNSFVFVGYLVMKGNTTDLTNTSQNNIVQSGIFRNTIGGSGGGGAIILSLEDLTNVLITSITSSQALIWNSSMSKWVNGNPATSSYALTSSYIQNAQSASYVATSSWSNNSINAQTASYIILSQTASYVNSASYALSSSFASSLPVLYLKLGDQLISSSLPQNIIELVTPSLPSNTRWKFYGTIMIGCNNTGGVNFATSVPSGSSLAIGYQGRTSLATTYLSSTNISSGALTGLSFCTQNISYIPININGEVLIGNISGSVQFQYASGVNTQISTIYQLGTSISYHQII